MQEALLRELKKITPEEARLRQGGPIEKSLYTSGREDVIDAGKLLEQGKLIEIRTHTRFAHFPRHRHNYIEVIYMCQGSTTHIIDGTTIVLKAGELLFLNQQAEQEIAPAGEEDIGVNFIILPEFFDYVLPMISQEQNRLRDFVVSSLTGKNHTSGYLHFRVSDVLPVQNLVENLIWSLQHKLPNRRSTNQVTMGLLFLQLMNYLDRVELDGENERQKLTMQILNYLEEHYRDGELTQLAGMLHYDVAWLSREVRKLTGRNYTELVQEKRLEQAAWLLTHTAMSVLEIGLTVGYDNQSYFHRIFKEAYKMTPRKYRLSAGQKESEPVNDITAF
jgi:AraC-like DNA-binding protein